MNEALKLAKSLSYQFLFHSKDHEEKFLADSANEVLMTSNAVLFIENDAYRTTIYPAFENQGALKKALGGLYHMFGSDKTVYINISEDETQSGLLESVHTTFINSGCKLISDNIAMSTKRLVGFKQIVTDNVHPFKGNLENLYQLSVDLLNDELFNMTFEAFKSFFESDESIVLTISDEQTIKGFIFGLIYNNNQNIFIRGLGVHKEYQGMGLSKKLMQALFDQAKAQKIKQAMLWVEANNLRAINLYKQFDFRVYGDKERLYAYTVR